MNARITVVGNLAAAAVCKVKKDGTPYHIITVAANATKGETVYYSCFLYGVSEERAKLLTQGSLVYVYGIPSDSIEENPKTGEAFINHAINVRELEIIYSKKEGQ